MSQDAQSDTAKTQAPSTAMRGEIQQRLGKFTEQEIGAIKDNNDLMIQVQAKYTIDKTQAKRDVDAFAKGRQL